MCHPHPHPHPKLRAAAHTDVDALQRFVAGLSLPSRTQRFFAPLRSLPAELVRVLQRSDPAHHFVVAEHGGAVVALGQYAVEAALPRCELALVIGDAWQGRGLGARLVARLLGDAAAAGLRDVVFETMAGNAAMCRLARRCGFVIERHPDDATLLRGRRVLAPWVVDGSGWGQRAEMRPAGPTPAPPFSFAGRRSAPHGPAHSRP